MSISFSGLASGLDTSSWVKSLTALKRAKVTTMEQEKTEAANIKDTLASIKTFFNSFRATLQKATDAKFGTAMDVFAKKLATSSNTSILTASATTEAKEATYDVVVDKIATATKASSKYSDIVDRIKMANLDSKLTSLGMNIADEGSTITVSKNGVNSAITLNKSDTIASLLNKLKNVGVEANYNEQTGVFSMNVGINDITDTDSTRIKDCLHLQGVNTGYETGALTTTKVENVVNVATRDTLMSDLGVDLSQEFCAVECGKHDWYAGTTTPTLGDFMDFINSVSGSSATLSEDGVLEISGITPSNDYSIGVLESLGLTPNIVQTTQMSKPLSLSVENTEGEPVTGSTLLGDIFDFGEDDARTVYINGQEEIEFTSDMRLQDFIEELEAQGLTADLYSDGTITISNGQIASGTLDLSPLGLTTTTNSASATSGVLTETIETHTVATLDTKLYKLGIDMGIVGIRTSEGWTSGSVSGNSTLGEFLSNLNDIAVDANIGNFTYSFDAETGVITFGEGCSVYDMSSAHVNEAFYGSSEIPADNTRISSTQLQSEQLYYTNTETVYANEDSRLINYFIGSFNVYANDGHKIVSNMQSSAISTLGDLVDGINAGTATHGVSASITNGVLSFENGYMEVVSSTLDNLNLTTSIEATTYTGNVNTVTNVVNATDSDTLGSILGTNVNGTFAHFFNRIEDPDQIAAEGWTTVSNFSELYSAMNGGASKILLTNDINVANNPIQTYSSNLTINGNGYTISGLNAGLIHGLSNGEIYNLKLEGTVNGTTTDGYGLLVDNAIGEINIHNVTVDGMVTTSSGKAGLLFGTIGSNATVTLDGVRTSGVVGNDTYSDSIVGGIVGDIGETADVIITNCSSSADVRGSIAGGIIGRSQLRYINNVGNKIKMDNVSFVGGSVDGETMSAFVGQFNCYDVSDMNNIANMYNLAGFAGEDRYLENLYTDNTSLATYNSLLCGFVTNTCSMTGNVQQSNYDTSGSVVVRANDGTLQGVIALNDNMALSELFGQLNTAGVFNTASITDGVINISSANNGSYIANTAATADLGITTVRTQTGSIESGNTISGSTAVDRLTYPEGVTLTGTPVQWSTTKNIYDYTNDESLVTLSELVSGQINGIMTANGVIGDIIRIGSVSDLQNLATLVNSGHDMSGITFVQTANIDLTDVDWTSIGTNTNKFKGTYDGAGYTISNFEVGTTGGLFGSVKNATIKNVTVDGVTNTETSTVEGNYFGILANHIAGESDIHGCHISNVNIQNITTSNQHTNIIGGIAGLISNNSEGCTISVEDCSVSGTNLTVSYGQVGGICGEFYSGIGSSASLNRCESNIANIQGTSYSGGLIGDSYADGTLAITNCLNKSAVVSSGSALGGIIGIHNDAASSTVTIQNNINYGEINSNAQSYGNIIGNFNTSTSNLTYNGNYFSEADSGNTTAYFDNNGEKHQDGSQANHVGVLNVTISTPDNLLYNDGASLSIAKINDYTLISNDNGYSLTQCHGGDTLDGLTTTLGNTISVQYSDSSPLQHKVQMSGSETLVDKGFYNVIGMNTTTNEISNGLTYKARTTVGDITGTNDSAAFQIYYFGNRNDVTASSTQGLAQLANSLQQNGINVTQNSDKSLTLTPEAGYAIVTTSNANVIGFGAYSTEDYYNVVHRTMDDYGIGAGQISFSDGTTISYTASDNLDDVLSQIAAKNGGTAGLNANHRLRITTGDGTPYITSLESDFASAFDIDTSDLVNSTPIYSYTSTSGTLTKDVTTDMDDMTVLSDLGITSGSLTIDRGENFPPSIFISSSSTLGSLRNQLAGMGISTTLSDGQLVCQCEGDLNFIDISGGNAASILGLTNGNKTQVFSQHSDELSQSNSANEIITGSTKLVDITKSGSNNVTVETGNYYVCTADGVKHIEEIDENTTVNSFLTTLRGYGFNANLNGGNIEITGNGDAYLESSDFASNNSNIVDILGTTTKFTTYFTDPLGIDGEENQNITRDTKLSDINGGTYQSGYVTVVNPNGSKSNINLGENETVGSFLDKLADKGFDVDITSGTITVASEGALLTNYTGVGQASNALDILGLDSENWRINNTYTSNPITVIDPANAVSDIGASRDTELSELGVTTGEYNIYSNGVKYTAYISSDETLGSFVDTLKSFGLSVGVFNEGDQTLLKLAGNGNSYLETSTNPGASNVVSALFNDPVAQNAYTGTLSTEEEQITHPFADENTKIGELAGSWGETVAGTIAVNVNDTVSTINISNDDTIGDVLERFRQLGLEAAIADGKITIQGGFNTFSIDTSQSTSSLANPSASTGLVRNENMDGYVASSEEVMSTVQEVRNLSVANWADLTTKLGTLNISSGSLAVYKNGAKAVVHVDSSQTFSELREAIRTEFGDRDIDLTFEDGYLKIFSKSDAEIQVGSSIDTSNFSSITGIQNKDGYALSGRELYKVNSSSKITEDGLFRRGDVYAGAFTIGNASFKIDENTTIQDLVNQINNNSAAGATAYWDNITGNFVIESKITGASYLNIEAGNTSDPRILGTNFTDVMGYTETEGLVIRDPNAVNTGMRIDSTRMLAENQELGNNAVFTINGTQFTSTSNTISSDVSRIEGVTINLKDVSKGEVVKLTIEKNKETVADTIGDIITSYNELMENVDAQLAATGDLHRETTLKMIRDQLRNLMTSSVSTNETFKNLDAIGIGVSQASVGNISTANSSVINLSFDRDKFISAFEKDADALKQLLVGTEEQPTLGILNRVETLLDNTLKTSGYFDIATKSQTKKISDLNSKISRQNQYIERYKPQLENKFKTMDMLISQMNDQYRSFLAA